MGNGRRQTGLEVKYSFLCNCLYVIHTITSLIFEFSLTFCLNSGYCCFLPILHEHTNAPTAVLERRALPVLFFFTSLASSTVPSNKMLLSHGYQLCGVACHSSGSETYLEKVALSMISLPGQRAYGGGSVMGREELTASHLLS